MTVFLLQYQISVSCSTRPDTYTVVVDHTLALTGIPIVPFTVYFSESVTSTSLFRSWSSSLSGIEGISTQFFELQKFHPFPDIFESPLADSDAIVAATEDNAPEPGNTDINCE